MKKIFMLLVMLCALQAVTAAASLVNNGNGTVTDSRTGLVWQQGEPGTKTWGAALSYCEGLSLGNKTDWRLPNIKELESLTDDARYYPAIDTLFFPGAYASYYWSSTTYAYYPHYAWDVSFGNGYVVSYVKYGNFYVRCVRGGQYGGFVDLDIDGLPDAWELKYFGNLAQGPYDDYDHDNLNNLDEYQQGTDPAKWDTDGDGMNDGDEVAKGKDPLVKDAGVFEQPSLLTYKGISCISSPTAKNLVFITHGWNSNSDTWVKAMREKIYTSLTNKADWDVCTYDWSEYAATFDNLLPAPWDAYVNAIEHGKKIAQEITAVNYNHIHFIAHSAGSNLIQSAADWINSNKQRTSSQMPTIHMTFLDAYDPSKENSRYGKGADFAEQYVDTRRVGVSSLDDSDLTLPFAYNFDVTSLDIQRGNDITGEKVHAWPYRLYIYSIDKDQSWLDWGSSSNVALFQNENILYGYRLSYEKSGSVLGNENLYYGFPRGATHTFSGTPPPPEPGGLPVIKLEQKGILDFNSAQQRNDLTTSESCIPELSPQNSLIMRTCSPVWVIASQDIASLINTLTFDYQFTSIAKGLLSVYFDGQLVNKVDGQNASDGINHSDNVALGDISPGKHTVSFRLDPSTQEQAVIELSNVQFSAMQVVFVSDADNDGHTSDVDCNDNNPAINPGAAEIPNNNLDDDCNPATPVLAASGAGYNYPAPLFKASLTLNVNVSSLATGWLKYSFKRMSLSSTSITNISVINGTATIIGVGKVNGAPNYTFTATAQEGSPDLMGIEIRRPDNTLYFNAALAPVSSGNYSLAGQ
ncbi:MAG: DUF1566 domain-containing protein [Nitrospirae bacterium]|nr:DUF1566 domain-containing protein [Nitrospirota bacterium]